MRLVPRAHGMRLIAEGIRWCVPARRRRLRDELGSCARCSTGAVRAELFVLNARRKHECVGFLVERFPKR